MTPRHRELGFDYDGIYQGTEAVKKPEKNNGQRRCKLCQGKLSQYNMGDYCFVHQFKGAEIDDQKLDKKLRKAQKEVQNKLIKKRSKNPQRRKKDAMPKV